MQFCCCRTHDKHLRQHFRTHNNHQLGIRIACVAWHMPLYVHLWLGQPCAPCLLTRAMGGAQGSHMAPSSLSAHSRGMWSAICRTVTPCISCPAARVMIQVHTTQPLAMQQHAVQQSSMQLLLKRQSPCAHNEAQPACSNHPAARSQPMCTALQSNQHSLHCPCAARCHRPVSPKRRRWWM